MALRLAIYVLVLVCSFVYAAYRYSTKKPAPLSVNYHFTRRCNKECGFCFHTAKTSYMLEEKEAKHGLELLKRAGMRKLNFAGGEPFLYSKHLGALIPRPMPEPGENRVRSHKLIDGETTGELVRYGKEDLGIESISIVTNGSLVREDWLRCYGQHLDLMAVSCDSFDEDTNIRIGRGSGDNVTQLFKLRDWCSQYGVKFKLNTVVCRDNVDEDMAARVAELGPFRWKCFQVLKVTGENDSDKTLRDVRRFEISDDEFATFCDRHKHLKCFVPESNRLMANSYLLLDEVRDVPPSAPSPMIPVSILW